MNKRSHQRAAFLADILISALESLYDYARGAKDGDRTTGGPRHPHSKKTPARRSSSTAAQAAPRTRSPSTPSPGGISRYLDYYHDTSPSTHARLKACNRAK